MDDASERVVDDALSQGQQLARQMQSWLEENHDWLEEAQQETRVIGMETVIMMAMCPEMATVVKRDPQGVSRAIKMFEALGAYLASQHQEVPTTAELDRMWQAGSEGDEGL